MAPIFLEAVLGIESQSYLEEKVKLSILKDPTIFTSIAPVLLDRSHENS